MPPCKTCGHTPAEIRECAKRNGACRWMLDRVKATGAATLRPCPTPGCSNLLSQGAMRCRACENRAHGFKVGHRGYRRKHLTSALVWH